MCPTGYTGPLSADEIAELRRELDELRKTNIELEQFAYVVSHDLREPLRMITSFAQLLSRRYGGRLDDDADAFLGFITDGAVRMERLIADILEFSRMGRCVCRISDNIESGDVLFRALNDLAPSISEAQAHICIGEMPAVICDDQHLERVFANLIGNSLKYRVDSRRPVICISGAAQDDGVHFQISDNGPGIAAADRDRIFLAFTRLQGRDIPGTGLGLAICRKIIDCHNGRLWVEDGPDNQGCCFHFTLTH